MPWIRAVINIFSFAMLMGAGATVFCQRVLPRLNANVKSAELAVPHTGCQIDGYYILSQPVRCIKATILFIWV